MALAAFVSLGLSVFAAYFDEARLDGNVLYLACACGFTRAQVSGGKVVLMERNHDRAVGTVVATIEIKDRICTVRRIGKNGTPGPAERYQVDHLGAKYYDKDYGSRPFYVLMTDNWKLCPATLLARVKRLIR